MDKMLSINKLQSNQSNPRIIKDNKFKKLVQMPLYDFRNEILKLTVTGEVPPEDEY